MPILCVARVHARVMAAHRAYARWAAMARACAIRIRFWASGGAKFLKMGDSLPCTPMNRRAKFDAASFILGREIRNHTNKQTNKITNSNRYIHTLPIGTCG